MINYSSVFFVLGFLGEEGAFDVLSIRTRMRHQNAERRTKRMQTRIAFSIAKVRIPPRAGMNELTNP